MLLTEFDQKEYEDMLRNEYLEEGRAEGQNHTFVSSSEMASSQTMSPVKDWVFQKKNFKNC